MARTHTHSRGKYDILVGHAVDTGTGRTRSNAKERPQRIFRQSRGESCRKATGETSVEFPRVPLAGMRYGVFQAQASIIADKTDGISTIFHLHPVFISFSNLPVRGGFEKIYFILILIARDCEGIFRFFTYWFIIDFDSTFHSLFKSIKVLIWYFCKK